MSRKPLTIAIDGPAGAGKSTVARLLAQRLGYRYIDSGAMYRAVALLVERAGLSLDATDAITDLTQTMPIRFETARSDGEAQQVFVGEEEVTVAIRTPEIASLASIVSAIPGVRAALVAQQQTLGAAGAVVMEGRDIGTVVFPQAEVKYFLTASPEERAARRFLDLQARGLGPGTIEAVLADQDARDQRDSTRAIAPLIAAPDAIVRSTDGLTPPEIVALMLADVAAREDLEQPL